MKRPIKLAKNLQQKFQTYIETDFWALDPDFQKARRELLNDANKKAVFQEPWFEIVRPYKSSGKKIDQLDLSDFNQHLNSDELIFFKNLVKSGLIDGNITLYKHQLMMIQEYWKGKNLVITTGTGSGKTESFLLPLFSYLSKYYLQKSNIQINNSSEENLWYLNYQINGNNRQYTEIPHRQSDCENACVKAIIFYPMNALVADQMNRLRAALASSEALDVFEQAGKGKLYFGKYNSTLKVARYNGNGTLKNKREIANEMEKHYEAFKKIKQKIDEKPEDKSIKELYSSTPNPFGSELLNRWDMQQTPPDLFITNYSMLNVMMMRNEENNFFTKTKDWLESDPINNIFHLIIDELHLNRGTAGAEVSWLLRLYLNRIGLHPGHSQLRILASSASLEGDKANEFLEDFFGYDRNTCNQHFSIISDEYSDVDKPDLDVLSDEKLIKVYDYLPDKNYERGNPEKMVQEIFNKNDLNIFLDNVKLEISSKIECCYPDYSRKTISKSELAQACFPNQDNFNQEKCLEAFLYIRSLFDERSDGRDLPRLRIHLLYNNLPGLFSKMDSLSGLTNDPFKMMDDNKRFAQLLVCYECGTLMYGGYRHNINTENGLEFEMLPVPQNLDASPDSYTQTIPDFMSYNEFVLFWPNELNNKQINTDAEQPFDTAKFGGRNIANGGQWVSASLNPRNGRIKEGAYNDSNWVLGYLFKQLVRDEEMKALPSQCPCCAQKNHFNAQRTTPFNHFSTPHNKTTQVLTTQLLKEISNEVDNRKLIVFSDSRNAAANLSARLELDNYWDSMRKIIAYIARYSEQDQQMTQRIEQIQNVSWSEIDDDIKEYIKGKGLVDGDLIQTAERRSDRVHYAEDIIKEFLAKIEETNVGNNLRISIAENILSNANATNLVLKRLLEKGIPPMGNTFKVRISNNGQNTYVPIRDFDNLKWYNLYNLKNGSYNFEINGNLDQRKHINDELKKEFTRGLFGKNRFSIEMMAKGYVAFKVEQIQNLLTQLNITDPNEKQKIEEVSNSFIRILGYKYRSIAHSDIIQPNDSKNNIVDFSSTHPVRQYLNKCYPNQLNIHNQILCLLNGFGATVNNLYIGGVIDPKDFDLILAKENSIVYICNNCQTPHLHKSGGVCAHCFTDLTIPNNLTEIIAGDLWKENYYTQNPEEDIIRLHCEELTGQTDDFEKRQRLFKNLFLEGEVQQAEQIDVISATTTMEVGIDIGSLSATLMGNMAPERFNYQQRVGRAGRGGQAFSVALTVCRSSSHDAFYYFNPDAMLNAKPPIPLIPISLNDIKERFYFKELLRQVSMKGNPELEGQLNEKDTHGRLGKTSDFKENKDKFKDNLLDSIQRTIIDPVFTTWANYININKSIKDIEEKLNIATKRSPIPSGLASALAENGILPMFGMPTNVRVAYLNGGGEVDREAELALTEFAPSSELLKDKKYYPMEGITSTRYRIGGNLMNDVVSDEFNTFYYIEQDDKSIYVQNDLPEGNVTYRKAIMPKAYYSFKEIYETDNNKQRHQLSLPKIDTGIDDVNKITIHNIEVTCFKGSYFVFNDNKGQDFEFYENNYSRPQSNVNLYQWSINSVNNENMGTFSLANKTFTTLLEIGPKELPSGLRLGLYQDSEANKLSLFRNTAIQAAAYSAAFILRNVYTTDKDIDGEEIRILKLRQHNDVQKLNILLADKLVNGSGFCKELYDNISHYFNLCFDKSNPFASRILSEENLQCDTASYQNLMNFRNQKFHPILDWRLGLSYLRLLMNMDNESVLNANTSLHEFKNYNSSNNWSEGFQNLFSEWVNTTQLGDYHCIDNIPICLRNGHYIIGIHPLWDVEAQSGSLYNTINKLNCNNPIFIDSFNLIRRPGACYSAVVEAIPNNDNIAIP